MHARTHTRMHPHTHTHVHTHTPTDIYQKSMPVTCSLNNTKVHNLICDDKISIPLNKSLDKWYTYLTQYSFEKP